MAHTGATADEPPRDATRDTSPPASPLAGGCEHDFAGTTRCEECRVHFTEIVKALRAENERLTRLYEDKVLPPAEPSRG